MSNRTVEDDVFLPGIVLRLHSSQNWIFRTLIPECLHYSSMQMLHYHLFQHGVGSADAQCYLLVSQTSHQMVPQTSHETLRASESLLRRDRRSSSHHCSGWVSVENCKRNIPNSVEKSHFMIIPVFISSLRALLQPFTKSSQFHLQRIC